MNQTQNHQMGKRRSSVVSSVGSCVKETPTNPRTTKMVSASSDDDCGLALKLQKLPSCNDNMALLIPHHHHDHGGESGPLCFSRSTNSVSSSVPEFTHIYNGALLPPPAADVFPPVSRSNHSSGESPFTAAQWQELERQTIILKYLMASLPLPPHLIPKPPSNMGRHSLELGISTRQSDPEPWRCKRTDGKKWRCSRDVAPDHKYCERHTRKSRPRSRKPVEFHFDDNTTMNHKPNLQGLTPSSYFPFFSPPATAAASDSIPYEPPSNLEWFLKGEANAVPSDYYYMRKDDKDSIFGLDHHREKQPTFPSTPLHCEWLGNDDHYNTWFYTLPKSTTSSMDAATATALTPGGLAQGQETRHFLDAWSTTNHREKNYITRLDRKKSSPVSSADKATLPLTLSMCGGDGGGGGSTETSYEEVEGTSLRTQWLPHGSWPMSSPPGGPLAEALCLGISSSSSKSPPNLTSGINSSFPDKW